MGDKDYPGEPWEHYILKNKVHGYQCEKCGLCGQVEEIRSKQCTIPPPQSHSAEPSPPSSSLSIATTSGASAAVVGREAALAGLAHIAAKAAADAPPVGASGNQVPPGDIEKEIAELEVLERKLKCCLEEQDLMEEYEALELQELEAQITQLEQSLSEEEQLERAIRESLEEHHAREAEAGGDVPEPLVDKSAGIAKPPVVEPTPPKLPDDPAKIVPLDPKARSLYVNYWSRFVATPQRSHPCDQSLTRRSLSHQSASSYLALLMLEPQPFMGYNNTP